MHQPYKVDALLKLPLGIESIKAIDHRLIIGTKQGHLLMYNVPHNGLEAGTENHDLPDPQIIRSNKHFNKKSITQLEAVQLQDFSILLVLCDSMVTVHDLDPATNMPMIMRLDRTKGT